MDIASILTSLCCGCWIIPLIAFGGLYSIAQSIGHAWHSRGIERDGMYCACCKFDVRGATGETCPECGASLLKGPTTLIPRGGIVVQNVDPPMSQGARMTIYFLAGFAPIVAGVIMLGLLLPINYMHSTWVYLTPTNQASYDSISFGVDAERSWLGNRQFDELMIWQANYQTIEDFNDADQPSEALARKLWQDIMTNAPELVPIEEQAELGDEFVAVLLAACDFDQEEARGALSGFQMDWQSHTEPSYHPLYTLFCFIAVIGGIVILVMRAQKDHETAHKDHLQKVEAVQQRYRQMLEANQPPG